MQVDPIYPETQEYLLDWLKNWCESHPSTNVVRFTSMFYNFVWMWGSSSRNRNLFTDWGSYDFTVSPRMLDQFAEKYGYRLTAEDFINKGNFHVTHTPPVKTQRDYMDHVNRFVVSFGKKLVDLVHSYGKQAYVFYDDSWVGVEPYGERFTEFGFDGLIKCVFSGYEVRLCAGAKAPVHELRFHPYLFPVGLGGLPTFEKGGDPTRDARKYWVQTRRAMLRAKIDRIGLGGYLHLTEDFPDFVDYMAQISDEFRAIKSLHQEGAPSVLPIKVAVLHAWGKLRSWTLSGHFHETYMYDLIHVNEALSGLPVDVSYISFEDVKNGALSGYDVCINAGSMGTAWSGGKDTPARACHGKWSFDKTVIDGLIPEGSYVPLRCRVHLTDGNAKVLLSEKETPLLTVNDFGKGKGIYLSTFETCDKNNRLLLNLLLLAKGEGLNGKFITDNALVECAYFAKSKKLVVINNASTTQQTNIQGDNGQITVKDLEPFETRIIEV